MNKSFHNTMAQNLAITKMLSAYINQNSRFITKELVLDVAEECHVSREEAFLSLLSAALGLDTVENCEDRALEKTYLRAGLHALVPAAFYADEYCKTVHFPTEKLGKWEMRMGHYASYEVFVCDELQVSDALCEVPQIGYFSEDFYYPQVLESGVEWMTVTPNEINTMKKPLSHCRGKALTLGLGLGYFTFHASQKAEVESITVVERDTEIIKLFCDHILPQFPNRHKVRVIEADAFDYIKNQAPRERFDTAFCDLWHDQSDGLEMYARLMALEKHNPHTRFDYWIEPTLLSALRRILYDQMTASGIKTDEEQLRLALQNSELRALLKARKHKE